MIICISLATAWQGDMQAGNTHSIPRGAECGFIFSCESRLSLTSSKERRYKSLNTLSEHKSEEKSS